MERFVRTNEKKLSEYVDDRVFVDIAEHDEPIEPDAIEFELTISFQKSCGRDYHIVKFKVITVRNATAAAANAASNMLHHKQPPLASLMMENTTGWQWQRSLKLLIMLKKKFIFFLLQFRIKSSYPSTFEQSSSNNNEQ